MFSVTFQCIFSVKNQKRFEKLIKITIRIYVDIIQNKMKDWWIFTWIIDNRNQKNLRETTNQIFQWRNCYKIRDLSFCFYLLLYCQKWLSERINKFLYSSTKWSICVVSWSKIIILVMELTYNLVARVSKWNHNLKKTGYYWWFKVCNNS